MFLLIHLSLGPLLVALGILFKVFPPKKINHLYGYRTQRSMKSQEVWDEANRYSSNMLFMTGIVTSILQAVLYYFVSFETGVLIAACAMVVLLIITIPLTESHLKKNFDENGNKK